MRVQEAEDGDVTVHGTMARAMDELIEWVLEEVVLAGGEGGEFFFSFVLGRAVFEFRRVHFLRTFWGAFLRMFLRVGLILSLVP